MAFVAFDKEAPASGVASVTPSDTAYVEPMARAIYIGGDGNVAIECPDGTTATLSGVLAGSIIPVQCVRVLATGTTATNIVALL